MEKVMEAFPYKRVAVIGCPGGGKSTFSRALRDRVGLPLYHLDAIYWKEDRTHLSREEFYPLMREIITREEWIMDGNYNATLEWRIAACDILFFLDYPAEVCLAGSAPGGGRRGRICRGWRRETTRSFWISSAHLRARVGRGYWN